MEARERKRIGKAVLWSVAGTVVVILVVLVIVPYTGAVDVAATHPHLPGVHWFLETTQKRSVASRAAEIQPPGDLASPQRIQRGLAAYHEMCVVCHGAPGVEAGWMGRGLSPEPPQLWEEAEREIAGGGPAEDFWVIHNGIRMTGMPALAPTHDEAEIWDLVAFVQHLPEMSAESYASSVREAGLSLETGHEHGAGGHGREGEDPAAEPPGEEGDHHHEEGEDHHHEEESGGHSHDPDGNRPDQGR